MYSRNGKMRLFMRMSEISDKIDLLKNRTHWSSLSQNNTVIVPGFVYCSFYRVSHRFVLTKPNNVELLEYCLEFALSAKTIRWIRSYLRFGIRLFDNKAVHWQRIERSSHVVKQRERERGGGGCCRLQDHTFYPMTWEVISILGRIKYF